MDEDRYEPPRAIHSSTMGYRVVSVLKETHRARHFEVETMADSPSLSLKKGERLFAKEWLPVMVQDFAEQVDRAEQVYRDVQKAGIEGLVGAVDLFWCHGRRYVITRYLPGAQDPIVWCQRSRSRLELQQRVAYLMSELIRLVFELHRLGFVHRDIHWGNVLIDENSRVYLVDFTEAILLKPEGQPSADIATGKGHQAPGFEPTECHERDEPHGPQGDLWQVAALGFGLITGTTFERNPAARRDYPRLIPKDLDGGLQDFLSQGLNPDPAVRFTSPDVPLRLLSNISCRPGSVPLGRLARQVAMEVDRSAVWFYQDFLPSRTGFGLVTAMVALASLAEIAAGRAQGWVIHLLGGPVWGDAAWGAFVAAAAGLGAAGEHLWRLDGKGALITAGKAGLSSALGGLAGMVLASLLLFGALDGSIPGLSVDLRLLPTLHLLSWMIYGAGAGLGFGLGLLWARWLGIGRAALGGGLMGGIAGGVLFVAFSQGTIPGPAGINGLAAARYSSAAAISGSLALFTAFTHRRLAQEARLKAWAKGCPPEIALPLGEPVVMGRRVGPFYLSSEREYDVPDRFLEIRRETTGLRLVVLAPGRGLLNNMPLETGRIYPLRAGDWLDVGRRSVFRVETGGGHR